jgi:SAM-dependent methyltransferase
MGALSRDDSLPLAGKARELTTAGPRAAPPGTGRLRGLTRRIPLRLVRSFSRYQELVNTDLVEAVEKLDTRLREQERLQLGPLTEDLLEALDSLRSRVAAADEIVVAARALPYTEDGTLITFRHPSAGVVLGFSGGGEPATSFHEGFAASFRGSEDRVRERQRAYLEVLEGHGPVLDVGCGRGELLDLLRERGVDGAGVDSDPGMVARCHAKGHREVTLADANEHLEQLAPGSLGAVFSAQFVEHLPQPALMRFLDLSHSRLRPGGVFVAETVNPHAPHALKCFWVDPTHRHPLFPEALLVLCRMTGFASGYAFHPLGTGHVEDDRHRESEYAVVATNE